MGKCGYYFVPIKKIPPFFFDIMTHLVLHVVDELDICGPIHDQWMYLVECMMKILKGYVPSMAHPEGSMVENYVLEETLWFVIEYIHEFEHVSRKVWDAKEEEGVFGEVLEGASLKVLLNPILRDLTHKHVLTNIDIMTP
jgi:hypothetical protein